MLQVKNCDKLQSIFNFALSTCSSKSADDSDQSSVPSCVLIEVPTDEQSADEDFVCNYHDTVIYSDVFPKPIIQLPV